MASPLPLRPSIDHTPRAQSAIDLGADGTTDVLESLASGTARDILCALASEPATATEVADHVGTSVQNAHYHLTNLLEADLVSDVGTWYSSKGREMSVYAVTSERLELRIRPGDSSPPSGGTRPPRATSQPTPHASE